MSQRFVIDIAQPNWREKLSALSDGEAILEAVFSYWRVHVRNAMTMPEAAQAMATVADSFCDPDQPVAPIAVAIWETDLPYPYFQFIGEFVDYWCKAHAQDTAALRRVINTCNQHANAYQMRRLKSYALSALTELITSKDDCFFILGEVRDLLDRIATAFPPKDSEEQITGRASWQFPFAVSERSHSEVAILRSHTIDVVDALIKLDPTADELVEVICTLRLGVHAAWNLLDRIHLPHRQTLRQMTPDQLERIQRECWDMNVLGYANSYTL